MLMKRPLLLQSVTILLAIIASKPARTHAQDNPTRPRVVAEEKPSPNSGATWHKTRDRLVRAMRRANRDASIQTEIDAIAHSPTKQKFTAAMGALTLLRVSINPESRVKLSPLRPKIHLTKNRPQVYFVVVQNTAGITAPLNLTAIDLSADPPGVAEWCKIQVLETPHVSRFFSGESSEYKVIEITPRVTGLREIRIVGDAGQGTQDLGFRATADIMLDIKTRSRP